jgi:L-ribulose-5-phosphate 4-epimerase
MARRRFKDGINVAVLSLGSGCLMSNLESIDPGALGDLKRSVVEVARGLFENKLVVSTFGVVSTRIPNTDYVLITPSGFSKARLDKDNLIIVDLEANLVQGKFRPSVETPMHTHIHKRRPDLSTVIHTHSPMACAFAAANMEIPCVSAEQAFYLGGRVPLVREYSLPGTNKPSELENIVKALQNMNAVLMRKHGVVVVGKTPEEALDTAIVLEDVAAIALHSILLSRPREFTSRELKYLKNFKATKYGQKPAT